jgi:phage baseplate assembly protein W
MVSRAFSIEDGNLNSASINVGRKKKYSDIDLTFARRPDNDVYKKTDAAAVKQSVKNILMTNYAERPFMPEFGANLNDFLFNLDTEFDDDLLEESIIRAIEDYEPRAVVLNVKVTTKPDFNSVTATVTFRVLSTNEVLSVNLDLTRLR